VFVGCEGVPLTAASRRSRWHSCSNESACEPIRAYNHLPVIDRPESRALVSYRECALRWRALVQLVAVITGRWLKMRPFWATKVVAITRSGWIV